MSNGVNFGRWAYVVCNGGRPVAVRSSAVKAAQTALLMVTGEHYGEKHAEVRELRSLVLRDGQASVRRPVDRPVPRLGAGSIHTIYKLEAS